MLDKYTRIIQRVLRVCRSKSATP